MKITRIEQETIILFNEEEKLASVYTYNKGLQKKLSSFALDFPLDVKLTKQDNTGAVTYELPKNLVSIRRPVGEKIRQARREQALKSNLGKKDK